MSDQITHINDAEFEDQVLKSSEPVLVDFWAAVTQFQTLQAANGRWASRRQQQSLAWMWERIDAGLKQAFRQHPAVQADLAQTLAQVQAGTLAASTAARNMLQAYAGRA